MHGGSVQLPCGGEAVMSAIRDIFFDVKDRRLRRWPKGFWLGAALLLATAGAGLGGVIGGVDEPSLQADAPPKTPTTSVAADAVGEHDATTPVSETSARPSAEQQRRVFMLLLLNSAGPLRPYSGLSR
jgi:hypothetical protein